MILLQRIRNKIKHEFDKISNENLKRNLLNAIPFWAGAFVSGGIAVLYAKLFSLAEEGTKLIFAWADWTFFIITPACFVLSWWIVLKYSPYAKGSGIPQVSASIELANPKYYHYVNALLSIRVVVIKILSSLVLVFGGGVIGREGPTIQISASVFKKINDFLPHWYPKISKRNMIITGAAAGLASAFNTPLGGIVFAIEELTKTHFNFFKSALLTGVIIAGLTALSFLGPYLYLGYPELNDFHVSIILAIIPLSIVTGFGGSGMGRAIIYLLKFLSRFKKKIKIVGYLALFGVIVAALAIFVDKHIFGSGKEIMVSTLFSNEKQVAWYLPIFRVIGSILSFATGGSGGIFAPSLSAGASFGAVFAEWFDLSETASNLLILCGMTGFLTSITRSPFTSSILVLEMTNSHNVIFFIMVSSLIANITATVVSRHSFYDYLKDQYVDEIYKMDAVERQKENSVETEEPEEADSK
ncbi:MAG: chloride channel protein [Bacteroidetes bacterium]|nr:chloride channel protein [Bacteroidota bacterium]